MASASRRMSRPRHLARAGVGREQAAQHADGGGLAAAVGPRKPQMRPARTCRSTPSTTARPS
jgi:hypothetical protein